MLTTAPKQVRIEELQISTEYPRVEVIFEGATGLAWLQRPFYDEELETNLERFVTLVEPVLLIVLGIVIAGLLLALYLPLFQLSSVVH